MIKSSKSSLKKRSRDISPQHKNKASYKFSQQSENFCTWPEKGLELKGLSNPQKSSPFPLVFYESPLLSIFFHSELYMIENE